MPSRKNSHKGLQTVSVHQESQSKKVKCLEDSDVNERLLPVQQCLLCALLVVAIYFLVDNFTNNLIERNKNFIEYEQKNEILPESHSCPTPIDISKVDDKHLKLFSDMDEEDMDLNADTLKQLGSDILTLKQELTHLEQDWKQIKNLEKLVRGELSTVDDRIKQILTESGSIDYKIKKALDIYDADKLALFDYAAEYAGGEIISIHETTPFPTNKMMQFFGFFKLTYASKPKHMISPSCLPGDCFAFYGCQGNITIKLGKAIDIGSVSLEHSLLAEDPTAAPKEFKVYGLQDSSGTVLENLGVFNYDVRKRQPVQTFAISSYPFSSRMYEYVQLEILSNHENPLYTCIYRFRVHSK